jgi:hypothetical protein
MKPASVTKAIAKAKNQSILTSYRSYRRRSAKQMTVRDVVAADAAGVAEPPGAGEVTNNGSNATGFAR